jgi:signal peptidase II
MVWILIVILGAAADQLLKAMVSARIDPSASVPVIDGFFHLIHRFNTGAAWSLFDDQAWGRILLAAVSSVASLVMLYLIVTYPDKRIKTCLAFLCAGSIGNLIDRIRLGGVTDYLDFHFGTYVFPTFNLADSLIVCSSIALGLVVLFMKPAPKTPTPLESERKP